MSASVEVPFIATETKQKVHVPLYIYTDTNEIAFSPSLGENWLYSCLYKCYEKEKEIEKCLTKV